ncbi:unnamed protein product, partial [Discosporangium mesarthrocarpum]
MQCARLHLGEGESQAVGAPIGLLAPTEADIPALEAYALQLKAGGGGSPAPAEAVEEAAPAAASSAPVPTEPTPTLTGGIPPLSGGSDGRVVASGLAGAMSSSMGIDLSAISGTGPGGRIVGRDVNAAAASGGTQAGSAPAPAPGKPSWTPGPGVVAATPSARALAKSKSIDLSKVVGTGNFGRVTEADVLAALGQAPKAKAEEDNAVAAFTREAPELPDGPKVLRGLPDIFRETLGAMDGMQKAVSKNMEASMGVPVFRVSRKIRTRAFDDMYRQLKPNGVTVRV